MDHNERAARLRAVVDAARRGELGEDVALLAESFMDVEGVICWGVACVHESRALDMLARGERELTTLRAECERLTRERDEARAAAPGGQPGATYALRLQAEALAECERLRVELSREREARLFAEEERAEAVTRAERAEAKAEHRGARLREALQARRADRVQINHLERARDSAWAEWRAAIAEIHAARALASQAMAEGLAECERLRGERDALRGALAALVGTLDALAEPDDGGAEDRYHAALEHARRLLGDGAEGGERGG